MSHVQRPYYAIWPLVHEWWLQTTTSDTTVSRLELHQPFFEFASKHVLPGRDSCLLRKIDGIVINLSILRRHFRTLCLFRRKAFLSNSFGASTATFVFSLLLADKYQPESQVRQTKISSPFISVKNRLKHIRFWLQIDLLNPPKFNPSNL